ncbi:hypothetical protein DWB84_02740 [Saccharophagus sp. K07]|uniref:hypothetical protein n=1 Tax=Saccharophagus sp. K07 TaxID=2283636 RepID=UPI001651C35C|nr:hypothetical protein [Saccharophagus sp. K07]MBC6904385.1 hypothetical protein [Saccharophagus sp. K07]
MSDEHNPNPTVTPLGVVKLVLVLFIGVGALLAVLAVFGVFAWLSLWKLLLKLALVAAIITAATLLIIWLLKPNKS